MLERYADPAHATLWCRIVRLGNNELNIYSSSGSLRCRVSWVCTAPNTSMTLLTSPTSVPCTNCVAFSIECRIPVPKRKRTALAKTKEEGR